MGIIINATADMAIDRAHNLDRYDQLGGYDGINALFAYYEEMSDDIGENFELDIIAWCCEWSHCEDDEELLSFAEEHYLDFSSCEDEEEKLDFALDYFSDHTQVIKYETGEWIDGHKQTKTAYFIGEY